MKKVKELVFKYRSFIIYVLLGAMTTAINYAVYIPLHNVFNLTAALSNAIAWVIAVLFAFLTNKAIAFESRNWSFGVVIRELISFVACRLASGLVETALLFIFVDCIQLDGNITKLIVSPIVGVSNYLASKFLVFRK